MTAETKRRCRLWFVSVAIGVLVGTGVLLLQNLGLLEVLELKTYDLMVKWRAPDDRYGSEVVIIGVDDRDLEVHGYPLTDAKLAKALDLLLAHQPTVLGVDIFRDQPVPPPDEGSPPLTPGRRQLNDVLKAHENLIMVFKAADAVFRVQAPDVLRDKPDRVGFADVVSDADNYVRRDLMYLDAAEGYAASLPLQVAIVHLGMFPQEDEQLTNTVRFGEAVYPKIDVRHGAYSRIDAGGYQFMIDYRGPRAFRTFSLVDVLTGRVNETDIRGKAVLLGYTARSVKDYFPTPIRRTMPGVELHAVRLEQLIRGAREGGRPTGSWSTGIEALWVMLWPIVGGIVGGMARTTWRCSLEVLAGGLMIAVIAYFLLATTWVPVAAPVLGWFGSVLLVTQFASGEERKQRQAVENMFGIYVDRRITRWLLEQRPDLLEDGRPRPTQLVATVLFSDLQGYTGIAGKLGAERLVRWLNEYLAKMAKTVNDHHGMINDYFGDGILVVFGVPVARDEAGQQEDARHAVECALEMRRQLALLNVDLEQEGLPLLNLRIGIQTGELTAGGIGSSDRIKYAVIGDTVNVAARLESFGKDDAGLSDEQTMKYRCRIIAGAGTVDRLDGAFEVRSLGPLPLRNRPEPVASFAVLGPKPKTPEDTGA